MKKLTIACITYNQENFIKQALDSMLMQKTNFEYEIIISDDCSTDNTPEIIKEYANKYPDIIKPIYRNPNIGATENFVDTLSRAKTTYLAICEGDDYWTDPYKLQKQVDFLDAHPEYSACFHPVKIVWENEQDSSLIFPDCNKLERLGNVLTLQELLKENQIQTNSIVYRWQYLNSNIKDFFPVDILPGDWYLHLLHAKTADIAFLPEVMAVYRKHSGGIWYDKDEQSRNLHLKHGLKEIKFLLKVWENITDKSLDYLNFILPFIKNICDVYYSSGNLKELMDIKTLYPNEFAKVFECDSSKILEKKYKRYKKLFNIFLIISIVQWILLLILIATICFMHFNIH